MSANASNEICLRLREADPGGDSPDVGAFGPRLELDGTLRAPRLDLDCARLGPAQCGPPLGEGDGPRALPVFFTASESGIPRPNDNPELRLDDWNLNRGARGVVALTAVDRETGRPAPRRGLSLVAAVLPFAMVPSIAAASSRAGRRGRDDVLVSELAPAQVEGPPTLPESPDEEPPARDRGSSGGSPGPATATGPAQGDVAPPGSDTDSGAAGGNPSPGPAIPPASPGPSTAPSTQAAPAVPPPSTASVDPVERTWSLLEGEDVRVTLGNGSRVEGRLVAAQGDMVVLARGTDGKVVTFAHADVSQVNLKDTQSFGVRPPHQSSPPGTGMLITGAVFTGVAGTLLLSSVAAGAYCGAFGSYSYYGNNTGCWRVWVPLLVSGILTSGAGIPMIVVGNRRRKAWREREYAELMTTVAPSRRGWTGGLTVRF